MDAFATAPRPLLPVAGGTDLLLDLEQGRHSPVQTLIDVTSIVELTLLEQRGDELFIGAAVPVNRIATSPEVAYHAQALTEACDLIALASHGHRLVGDIIHGSTIEEVRHKASVPILVVPPRKT